MKEIKKHIKERKFAKVYLLTGDEGYLIMQSRMLLQNALSNGSDDMNFTLYSEGKADLNELSQLANTFPFFGEKRLIILDRVGILKSGKDEMIKIFEEMPETTCVVICEPDADKRTKLYKWIKKNGYIGEYLKKNQTDKVLVRFIGALLAKNGIQIRESDAYYMLSMTGNDMYQIRNETDKLISYMGEEKTVSREILEQVIYDEVQNKIFDMVSAIAERRKKQAIAYYEDLQTLREPTMHILFLILRQYRIMTVIKDMRNKRKPDSEIAKVAEIPPFTVRKYDAAVRAYDSARLEYCLRECVRTEQSIKEGRMGDQLALESLIIRLIDNKE